MNRILFAIISGALAVIIFIAGFKWGSESNINKLPKSYYVEPGKNYVSKSGVDFSGGDRLAHFETGVWSVMTEVVPISQVNAYPMYNGLDKFYLGQVLLPDKIHFDTLVVTDPEILTLQLRRAMTMSNIDILRIIYEFTAGHNIYNFLDEIED